MSEKLVNFIVLSLFISSKLSRSALSFLIICASLSISALGTSGGVSTLIGCTTNKSFPWNIPKSFNGDSDPSMSTILCITTAVSDLAIRFPKSLDTSTAYSTPPGFGLNTKLLSTILGVL